MRGNARCLRYCVEHRICVAREIEGSNASVYVVRSLLECSTLHGNTVGNVLGSHCRKKRNNSPTTMGWPFSFFFLFFRFASIQPLARFEFLSERSDKGEPNRSIRINCILATRRVNISDRDNIDRAFNVHFSFSDCTAESTIISLKSLTHIRGKHIRG